MSEPQTPTPAPARPNPKQPLLDTLADREKMARALAAAQALAPEDVPATFVRMVLLLAGYGAPPGTGLLPLIQALRMGRWQVVPTALEVPRAGDVYVLTDEERAPCDVGLVVGEGGVARGYVLTVGAHTPEGRPEKREVRSIDFTLRLPGG